MADASEEGTAQGYNEGRSLFTSSYCATLPSATPKLVLLARRQVCVRQVPLTTMIVVMIDLLWRQPSWPQRHSLNDLQLGCGSWIWSEFPIAGCSGHLKSETLLLWEFVFYLEELFLRVGEVEMKQTSQLCRTVLATLSPFFWIRNGLERGRVNYQEQRNILRG